jgi:hypothetical protein
VPHNDGGAGLAAAERWRELIGRGTLAELPDGVKDLNELGLRQEGEREFQVLMKALGFERTAVDQGAVPPGASATVPYPAHKRQSLASQL